MKKIVRQVGYLQRLYRDARSTEHKVPFSSSLLSHFISLLCYFSHFKVTLI